MPPPRPLSSPLAQRTAATGGRRQPRAKPRPQTQPGGLGAPSLKFPQQETGPQAGYAPPPQAPPRIAGPTFATRGLGKYVQLPNNNGRQFRINQPEVQKVVDAADRMHYFRHAGMGAAIRYSLGLRQRPYVYDQHAKDGNRMLGGRNTPGLDPGHLMGLPPEQPHRPPIPRGPNVGEDPGHIMARPGEAVWARRGEAFQGEAV